MPHSRQKYCNALLGRPNVGGFLAYFRHPYTVEPRIEPIQTGCYVIELVTKKKD